ncbi:MAG: DUF4142 domain-containing protein [Sphingobacteriales bacterium]|nr:MAG: DUF4142 domain-containing protein [Sphingobacteriales bacterium]
MRSLRIFASILPVMSILLLLVACQSSKSADKREQEDINESERERGVPETTIAVPQARTSDQIFVTKVIDDIDWLVVWIHAGLMKSTDTRHKVHAEAMLKDHQALLGKLAMYAYGEGYNIPKIDTGNVINITRKVGKGWDKDWASTMASKQQELIAELEARKSKANTKELIMLIDETLPVLRTHLEMTRQLMATPAH